MNKTQAILITLVLLVTLNFVLPMILSDFTIGFDLPPFGYITIFDPSSLFGAYNFLIGGFIAAIIMYIMITEIRKRNR